MKLNILWYIFILIPELLLIKFTSGDVFTALVEMEALLHTEKELKTFVDLYIEAEMKRLEQIKELAIVFSNSSLFSNVTNAEEFLGNPINAFLLVKRLSIDWHPLMTLMNNTKISEVAFNHLVNGKRMKFPDADDLNGAAIALTRLQKMYNLSPGTIAKGEILPGFQSSAELLSEDLFEVGRQLYMQHDYEKAIPWLEEALAKDEGKSLRMETKLDILEHLAFMYYMIENKQKAVDFITELLQIDPHHERGIANYEFYTKALQSPDPVINPYKNKDKDSFLNEPSWQEVWLLYEKLCRKEHLIDPKLEAKLTCYYWTNNNPFLILQPTKVEDIHVKPWLALFYDLLSNSEIELIKNLSTPKLQRASVINKETGGQEYASYRISKSSWLKDDDHPTIRKITVRIQEITGLNILKGAEELQIVNYGIGGHYDPHVDFAQDGETNSFQHLNMGNRIATILFYMSDVTAGGATVFPSLKVAVWPKKGAAAFWYNLYKNGKGDMSTQHAACPVLVGSKWVSNKWIHAYHQEFRRPCGLKEDDLYEK